MNITELLATMQEQDYEPEALTKVASLFATGERVLVYENRDLGHWHVGQVLVCGWGRDREDSPPKTYPFKIDGGEMNWRYALVEVLNP